MKNKVLFIEDKQFRLEAYKADLEKINFLNIITDKINNIIGKINNEDYVELSCYELLIIHSSLLKNKNTLIKWCKENNIFLILFTGGIQNFEPYEKGSLIYETSTENIYNENLIPFLLKFCDKNETTSELAEITYGDLFVKSNEEIQFQLEIQEKIRPISGFEKISKSLFIYSEAFCYNLKSIFRKTHCFDFTKYNSDESINDEIKDIIDCSDIDFTKIDKIIIPLNLSKYNLFEFKGLRIALHILLTELFQLQHCDIIFLSNLTKEKIITWSEFNTSILHHKFYIYPPEDFEKTYNFIKNFKPDNSIVDNDLIKLKPNSNFNYSHSITNEWFYFRIMQFVNKENSFVSTFYKSLYFKYLIFGKKRQKIKFKNDGISKKDYSAIEVTLVEDAINKGAKDFFESLIENNNGKLNLFNSFSSNKPKQELIKEILYYLFKQNLTDNKYYLSKSDLFILDLRLHNDDYNEDIKSKITGFEVLKFILKGGNFENENFVGNEGASVLILSASEKSWNSMYAIKNGALNYITKENPIYNYSKTQSKEILTELLITIEEAKKRKLLFNQIECIDKMFSNDFLKNNEVLSDLKEIKICLIRFDLESFKRIIVLGFNIFDKISDKYVYVDNRKKKAIVTTLNHEDKNISLLLSLKKDSFDFFNDKSDEYYKGYSLNPNPDFNDMTPGKKIGDEISLYKIIGLLVYRYEIQSNLEEIFELRCLRSKLIVHNTGKIDKKKVHLLKKENWSKISFCFINILNEIIEKEVSHSV